jgi:DNA-binding transcriptional LysR family regulator
MLSWPNLAVEVNFTDGLVDIVEEGFDLAIRIRVMPTGTRLVARVIARSQFVLCAAPSYLAAHGIPQEPSDLTTHHRLAFVRRAQAFPWRLRSPGGKEIEVAEPSRFRFDSGEAIRDSAVAGLGVAYLPGFLVERDIEAQRLVPLLPSYGTEQLPIYAIYPSRRHLSAKVRLFIDLLAARFNVASREE